jgi:hypothetical protein
MSVENCPLCGGSPSILYVGVAGYSYTCCGASMIGEPLWNKYSTAMKYAEATSKWGDKESGDKGFVNFKVAQFKAIERFKPASEPASV